MHRLILTALLLAPASAVAQDTRASVALLPFADGGSYGQDHAVFEGLRLAIPSLLAAELGRSPGLRVAEPALKADAAPRTDAGTAARVAQEAGASHGIAGTFMDHYGRFRLDARVVDAASGDVAFVASAAEQLRDRRQLAAMIRSLADEIRDRLELPAAAGAALGDVSFDAIAAYGQGLAARKAGDAAAAEAHFRRAVEAAPDFGAARRALGSAPPP